MFGALAGEEVRGGFGEEDADGEVGVLGEGADDVGELDGGDAAAGGQDEMLFFVVGVVGGDEGGGWWGRMPGAGVAVCGDHG